MNLKDQLTALQSSMRAIVDGAKAAKRDLTDAEMTSLEAKSAEAVQLKGKIEQGEKSAALMARIGGMKSEEAEELVPGGLSGAKAWGSKAADALSGLASRVPGGAKALTSGSVGVPSILSPVLIDSRPLSVLDLIPTPDPLGSRATLGAALTDLNDAVSVVGSGGGMGNGFAYLRQIARVNNAGAVPDFGDKPESTYTFDQVNDTFRVYANKTEALPWRFLGDFGDLKDILATQLRDDTLAKMEADVISGDGEDDRFLGLLETSGIQVQLFTTDRLTTLSAAKYKLIAQDRAITGWALNPLDLQALEMTRENGATGAFLFKSREEIEAFLGGPVVTTLGLPLGTAVVADWNQSELLPMGDDELVFNGSKRTENNTFQIMFEGRYGFRVKSPFDFVKVTLSA